MLDFLKIFGEGFLFFIGLPFILVGLVIYGIYLLFVFIFMSFKGIILFFKGKKYSLILNEDLKADQILAAQGASNATQSINTSNVTNNITYNQINVTPKQESTLRPVNFNDVLEEKDLNPSGLIEENNNGNRE